MNKENFGKKIKERIKNGEDDKGYRDLYAEALQYYTNQIQEALNPLPGADLMFAVAAMLNVLEACEHADKEGYDFGCKLQKMFISMTTVTTEELK